ncbi:MAG: small subunit ribosomal protein S1 [Elusimicrobia bacterium]|nr:MAG: small subunit ribosomal protein S1 [Elusimicrobiota bacterium]
MEETTEDFSKLFGESLKAAEKTYSPGDRVRAALLTVGQDDSFVALGPGKEGVVATADLRDADGTCSKRPGDALELFVTSVRPGGEVRLSTNPTDQNVADDLKEAFALKRPVSARVTELCKGGLRVSVNGKTAFCPISQIDLKRTETGAEYVGKTLVFRITEFSEDGRNVVVSRRKLLEEERGLAVDGYFAANPDGSVVVGKVTRLEKFGAFVELTPGVEGLAHVSELAWSRVESPSDLLAVGQEVAVKILKRETAEGRLKVALSLKQATERPAKAPGAPPTDPWAKYAVGQVVTGKVTRKEPYGLFVQLEPGVVGLLHQSKTTDHPEFQFERQKVGAEVQVQIDEVKLEERRISLGLPRDPAEQEWRRRQDEPTAPLGAFGDSLRAALDKKPR